MVFDLSQLQFSTLLLSTAVCIFMLLLGFIVWSLTQASKRSQQAELLQQALIRFERIEASLNTNQKEINSAIAEGQDKQFSLMLKDQQKQLTSMSELRIELEKRFAASELGLSNNIQEFKTQMVERFEKLQRSTSMSLAEGQQQLSQSMESYQSQTRELIVDSLKKGMTELRGDLDRSLKQQSEQLTKNILGLTETTDARLKDISGQVEKRLSEGFDRTTKTFNDVLKRLALIDDAQKKITELSTNVVSLQEILNDKRSRGAFGEVQLQSLVSNIMPQTHYAMQHKLSNEKIADCVLELPEPTGKIAIDAKFPLESYKKMMDITVAEVDRKVAAKQFSKDIKKHINDIADKYVLPPETSDGAVMFIPAESVFAEIHGHYPELVEFAYQRKVWLVSPTTLMAILTTASAVIKDEQTRKQVHIIKDHLSALGKDFIRFQDRMDNLSKHIGQVSKDVENVSTSARKISSRFGKIERVELNQDESELSLEVKK